VIDDGAGSSELRLQHLVGHLALGKHVNKGRRHLLSTWTCRVCCHGRVKNLAHHPCVRAEPLHDESVENSVAVAGRHLKNLRNERALDESDGWSISGASMERRIKTTDMNAHGMLRSFTTRTHKSTASNDFLPKHTVQRTVAGSMRRVTMLCTTTTLGTDRTSVVFLVTLPSETRSACERASSAATWLSVTPKQRTVVQSRRTNQHRQARSSHQGGVIHSVRRAERSRAAR
jgi:hypothetical protein